MANPLRISDLSPARQALVRLCQTINYGTIENLEVRNCEPVFDPPPLMLQDLKLDSDEGPRPELGLADFLLTGEVRRLMVQLDGQQSASIRKIEVRAGVPRRILLGLAVGGPK